MHDQEAVETATEATVSHRESIIALSEWLETAPGRYVLAWEQHEFDALVADIFGFNAVQIGLMELKALRSNRMPFVFAAAEPIADRADQAMPAAGEAMIFRRGASQAVASIYISLEQLPFASQSMDLVVLPHALEFAEDPHRVLREVERVLMPEGQIVISGFNPISLWGLRQVVGRTFDAPFLPREGQFLALPRLKDWLKLLGFEVHRGHFGCYRPPFAAERWQARFGFMEDFGDRWWSYCGAVYMVHAIKRVQGMKLIGPAWKERKRVPVAALQPSANRIDADHRCRDLTGQLMETEIHVDA